jgi:glycine/D-amino acid oxidase-like deaminating enzyme
MERRFRAFFPAWAHVEFTHFWAGFVCLAADLVPHVAPLDRDGTAWCGLAYHGNGVAGATWTGRLLARILAGAESPEAVPEVMRGPPPRFPLPGLRKSYLRAAYGAYALADARP